MKKLLVFAFLALSACLCYPAAPATQIESSGTNQTVGTTYPQKKDDMLDVLIRMAAALSTGISITGGSGSSNIVVYDSTGTERSASNPFPVIAINTNNPYSKGWPIWSTNFSWQYTAAMGTNTNGCVLYGPIQIAGIPTYTNGSALLLSATYLCNNNIVGSNLAVKVEFFKQPVTPTPVFGVALAYTGADAPNYLGSLLFTNWTLFGTTNSESTLVGQNIGLKAATNSVFAYITSWTNALSPNSVAAGFNMWTNFPSGRDMLRMSWQAPQYNQDGFDQ